MIPSNLKFSKLNSAGNDFICIDNTDGSLDPISKSEFCESFVRVLTQRGLGIGADGVIVACELNRHAGVDITARFLEPDGSEAWLCGNGTACFAYWAITSGLVKGPSVIIRTRAGIAEAQTSVEDPRFVTVCVPDPTDIRMSIPLQINNTRWEIDYVNTGVPHAVTYVEHLDRLDVAHWGKHLRHAPQFAPDGANANFVEILGEGRLAIRTFEFGVENETLACGTGSSAAAILAALRHNWPAEYMTGQKPVEVITRSGRSLWIRFVSHGNNQISDVCMQTRVAAIYDGTLRPEFKNDIEKLRESNEGKG
ncbi:MAG: diaminopimelate epimerase [Lentisphaeria bacterium]